jgi:hypothetical protein
VALSMLAPLPEGERRTAGETSGGWGAPAAQVLAGFPPDARQASDGNWYVRDQNRLGQLLHCPVGFENWLYSAVTTYEHDFFERMFC